MELRTVAQWTRALVALLPDGAAWNTSSSSILTALLSALSSEFSRIEARVAQLLPESDPSTTIELLHDWEQWLGLPSSCMALETQTLEERRLAIVDKLTDVGGQRPQDYINLAARFGVTVTITEFDVFTVMSNVAAPLNGFGWRFVWRVNMPPNSASIRYASMMSPVSQPLATWGNRIIECVIRARKPAETYVFFAYP